ncbi:MAG TPA: hypothetical protein VL221_02220 [Bacteroidota bacterium]|nr:hypothetical protein [Bacteroidota bacterium]
MGAPKSVPALLVHLCTLVAPAVTMPGLPVQGHSPAASPPLQLVADIPVILATLLI